MAPKAKSTASGGVINHRATNAEADVKKKERRIAISAFGGTDKPPRWRRCGRLVSPLLLP
jgi:hypothetical protein